MPDSLRDAWTGPRSGLSQIEFHTHVAPATPDQAKPADAWLAGQSVAIEQLRVRAQRVGSEGARVVSLHGEVGTGKLRVAQWIHRCSRRAARPLLSLEAGDPTLDEQLARVRDNLAEARDDQALRGAPGTLVVRNWERSSVRALEHLLDLLGAQGVELVCALILVSKRSPEQLRDLSPHHAALISRATKATLGVPALRHRRSDIGILARTFADAAARRYDRQIRGISPQALALLDSHAFPGNVRELQLMVEQAVLRCTGDWVTAEGFPSVGEPDPLRQTDAAELVIRMPGCTLREVEVGALSLALNVSEGKVVKAAELLGITRHALRRKLQKFDLNHLRASPPNLIKKRPPQPRPQAEPQTEGGTETSA